MDYLTNVSQLTNCKGVKMKPAIILLVLVLSTVQCNQNEFRKLRKWLSTPNFNFSHVPTEEQSLCQKHLELYTNSLSLNHGVPKSWAIKSKVIILCPLSKSLFTLMTLYFLELLVLDSTAKLPDGVLDFHIVLLGNIEECIGISVPVQQRGNDTLPGFQ